MSELIPNIEGKWKMTLAGDGNPKIAICTLIQVGNTLTGTFQGSMGDLSLTGSVSNDNTMAFAAKFIMGSLKFAGTIDGETMLGIVDFPMGKGRKIWTATKLIEGRNS
jgi:hypothetical protein